MSPRDELEQLQTRRQQLEAEPTEPPAAHLAQVTALESTIADTRTRQHALEAEAQALREAARTRLSPWLPALLSLAGLGALALGWQSVTALTPALFVTATLLGFVNGSRPAPLPPAPRDAP